MTRGCSTTIRPTSGALRCTTRSSRTPTTLSLYGAISLPSRRSLPRLTTSQRVAARQLFLCVTSGLQRMRFQASSSSSSAMQTSQEYLPRSRALHLATSRLLRTHLQMRRQFRSAALMRMNISRLPSSTATATPCATPMRRGVTPLRLARRYLTSGRRPARRSIHQAPRQLLLMCIWKTQMSTATEFLTGIRLRTFLP